MKIFYISKQVQTNPDPANDSSVNYLNVPEKQTDNIVFIGLNSIIDFIKETEISPVAELKVVYRNWKRIAELN